MQVNDAMVAKALEVWTDHTSMNDNDAMRCPVCHKWFDMRDLRDAFEHWHDGPELGDALPPEKAVAKEAGKLS